MTGISISNLAQKTCEKYSIVNNEKIISKFTSLKHEPHNSITDEAIILARPGQVRYTNLAAKSIKEKFFATCRLRTAGIRQ